VLIERARKREIFLAESAEMRAACAMGAQTDGRGGDTLSFLCWPWAVGHTRRLFRHTGAMLKRLLQMRALINHVIDNMRKITVIL
jgi:hypothetical protein